MNKLPHIALTLAVAGTGLALAGSAAGTTQHSVSRHFGQSISALAIDGPRIAYDIGARYSTNPGATNKVMVWNIFSGQTVKVSGKKTAAADSTSTGSGVFDLAIAGARVAWMTNEGGNLEGDDALFTSSVTKPGEHRIATAQRSGENCSGREASNCAGKWLGGLVGSGSVLAANRWTTDSTGGITTGGLYILSGTKLKQVAAGAETVTAFSADAGRIAMLHADGSVALYSATGKFQRALAPPPAAKEIALSGDNLVVLRLGGTLALYSAKTGAVKRTFTLHGVPSRIANVGVAGNIAIYTPNCSPYAACPSGSVRALNLKSGKDAWIATLKGGINLARIGTAGLVYAGNGWHSTFGKATLGFVPYSRVAAKVS